MGWGKVWSWKNCIGNDNSVTLTNSNNGLNFIGVLCWVTEVKSQVCIIRTRIVLLNTADILLACSAYW